MSVTIGAGGAAAAEVGAATQIRTTIAQEGHGFDRFDVVRFDAGVGAWVLASSTSALAAGAGARIGVVARSLDADAFELAQLGLVEGEHTIDVNRTVYLGADGRPTTDAPSIAGHAVVPIGESWAAGLFVSVGTGWVVG